MSWLAVGMGTVGLVAGLAAVRDGWRPRVRWLMAGSVFAVLALLVVPPVAAGDPLLYAAFGRDAVLGHSPYVIRPIDLLPAHDQVRLAVSHYVDKPSRYGPLTTVSEAAAAKLGGDSPARILFWLKVWNAAAFLMLILVLDRLVRSDAGRRVRVHLLWSLNPLMLFLAIADGHNDVLAAALGAAGLFALGRAGGRRVVLAGALLVLAVAAKASYAVYGAGALWTARRSPRSIVWLVTGAAAIVIPAYLLAGRTAISATTVGMVSGTPPNLLWHDIVGVLGWHDAALGNTLGLLCCGVLAVILLLRLPAGPPDVPAARVTLGLALALLIASPYQQGWYDAMLFPVLAVTAASRLDWIVIAHTTILAVASVPIFVPAVRAPWSATLERVGVDALTAPGIAVICLALLWLCYTKRWYPVFGRHHGVPEMAVGSPQHSGQREGAAT